MTSKITSRLARWLGAAGLAFIAAAAHAANGYSVTESQTRAVKAGMSTTEVQEILGPPLRNNQHRTAPGPIWTYQMLGAPFGRTEFDVDFGADGKVTSVIVRPLGSSH